MDKNLISLENGKTILNTNAIAMVFPDDNENDDDGYYDEVGGYHSEAIGWNPHGIWHGECTRASCKRCPYEHDTADPYREG